MLLALAAAFLSAAMAAPPSAPYHALDSNDGGAASYQNGHALGETQQEGFAPPVRQSQPTIVVGGQQQQAEQSQPLLQDSHAPPSHAEPLAHVPPAASAAASVQETSTSALDAPDPANKLCGVDKNLIRNYWSCFLFFSWRLNSAFLSINNYKTFSSSPSSDQTKLANKVGPFYIGSVLAPIIIYGACIYCCIRLFRARYMAGLRGEHVKKMRIICIVSKTRNLSTILCALKLGRVACYLVFLETLEIAFSIAFFVIISNRTWSLYAKLIISGISALFIVYEIFLLWTHTRWFKGIDGLDTNSFFSDAVGDFRWWTITDLMSKADSFQVEQERGRLIRASQAGNDPHARHLPQPQPQSRAHSVQQYAHPQQQAQPRRPQLQPRPQQQPQQRRSRVARAQPPPQQQPQPQQRYSIPQQQVAYPGPQPQQQYQQPVVQYHQQQYAQPPMQPQYQQGPPVHPQYQQQFQHGPGFPPGFQPQFQVAPASAAGAAAAAPPQYAPAPAAGSGIHDDPRQRLLPP